jgi:MFS family permease
MPQQRWLRIIPVAFVMYTIAFIDRTNISLALPRISHDLGMDPVQAGSAAGVFFWGYLLLQVPGGYIANRWSAKHFVSILLMAWGICAVGTGLVHTGREFWIMRFLLGVAEGGVWPAILVLLSHWFPRAERARANAFWMLCLPLSLIISSPLSGWILGRWDWRILLISEGALPIVWLIIWVLMIYDLPHHAPWISSSEREFLETTLQRESGDVDPARAKLSLPAMVGYPVPLMVCVYFLQTCGTYGFLFWFPAALENARKLTHLAVGGLFTLPYILTAIGMVWNARHSDLHHERRRHVAGAYGVGGVCLLIGVLTNTHWPLLSFGFLCLAAAGPYSALGPFWAIPTETLPSSIAGSAIGVVNAFGNLGGFFGPLIVGFFYRRTGNFHYAFTALAVGLLAASGLSLLLPKLKARPPH